MVDAPEMGSVKTGCVCAEMDGVEGFVILECFVTLERNDMGKDVKAGREMCIFRTPKEGASDFNAGYAERVFVYVAAGNVGLHARVNFLKAFHVDTDYNTMNQPRVMCIVTKREGVNRGGYLEKGTKIVCETLFVLTEGGITYEVAYRDAMVTPGTNVFISMITGARRRGPENIESVAFSVIVEECMAKVQRGLKATDGNADVPECPNCCANPFLLALLPVTLVIISLMTATIIVLFILDRQHGFTNKVDKLSALNLWRMCPALNYACVRHERGENAESSICLCVFESADQVRNLQRDHMYHTDCVDASFFGLPFMFFVSFCLRT